MRLWIARAFIPVMASMIVFSGCAKQSINESQKNSEKSEAVDVMESQALFPSDISAGTQMTRGFIHDNTLHSPIGDIHFSSYIPKNYDGTEPYALFVTLPG